MDIEVSFPGGKRVDARCGDFEVKTDQPADLGGEGSAIAPYDLFLASVANCAGVYVLGFCQARGLSTEGLALVQRHEVDPATKLVRRIRLELTLPNAFPERYRTAMVDPESFARHFGGCPVIMVSGRTYPVDVRWRDPHPPKVIEAAEDGTQVVEEEVDEDEPDMLQAIVRAAEGCKVKKTIAAAPSIEVAVVDQAVPLGAVGT